MNPSTTQARVVVDELIRGGVRDVVLCPGSRNAPLAFALQDADRTGRVRLHVRIDERTAGYLAIGLAVAAGAPVCVAMTSGTAVANLGPAVVEANYARVPLIVLSANRPYEMLGTGANQTMEQLGYFGTQVRATISLGLAEDARSACPHSTRPGDRRPAEYWWPPRGLVAPTPDRCISTSRCASRWCRTRSPMVASCRRGDRTANRGLTRRRSPSISRWTSTCRQIPSSSPGTVPGLTPIWRSCLPSPNLPRRMHPTRYIRSPCRCCVPSR
ncbi:thiamine pyrophosphate enzyme, N-terminal TPP binding domain protein [Mycobacterium kansasii]|uniref:Thiamine pyrophosphate enzyme, N-terminal TPP binding domain protein n=1 Tax=Mycobacterium kansasii TaxID=1768 RepID=A0A1V3WFQ5_MYCKA|nr:thiamine pyrophosphate enzyme, N-terminal TPP binding domain protein [Mycobacterium kansasii]